MLHVLSTGPKAHALTAAIRGHLCGHRDQLLEPLLRLAPGGRVPRHHLAGVLGRACSVQGAFVFPVFSGRSKEFSGRLKYHYGTRVFSGVFGRFKESSGSSRF